MPDLLFDDVVRGRLKDIDRYLESPGQIACEPMLHRMTVFLLYRCNLDCPYCKSIVRTADDLLRLPQRRGAVSLAAFRAALEPFRSVTEHVHFTGGEPTMSADLPAMIDQAVHAGVPHVSVTSNGLVSPARLEEMVANGLSEARISIDAREAVLGRHMTGRTDAWSKSVRTLDRLVQLRERHGRPFTIANTVVAHDNLADIGGIVRFLITRGVNDVKLITEVDSKETLGTSVAATQAAAEVRATLASQPAEAFPLLRRKIETVFSQDAIGLSRVEADPDEWRCYIPLTERTFDGVYYYPCSVYVREGGAPLGRVDDPADVQHARTAHFVREGRCLTDPICQRYCLHCTAGFNIAANDAANAARSPPVAP